MLSRSFVLVLAAAGFIAPTVTRAEVGFTYSIVRDFPLAATAAEERLCSYAFNDLGQIAYTTVRSDAVQTVSVYLWTGGASQLIYSSGTINAPNQPSYVFCSSVRGGVGLNNSGLISAYGTGTDSRTQRLAEGFMFLRAGVGLITTQFPGPPGSIYESRGLVNSAGQVAWRAYGSSIGGTVGVDGPVADGFANDTPSTIGFGGPVVSDSGAVAQLGERPEDSGKNQLALLFLDPKTHLTGSSLLNLTSIWFPPDWSTPGLNAKGFTAVATQSATTGFPNRQFRVVLIDPDLIHYNTLASDSNTTAQPTALPGISLNDKNQIVFGVHDLAGGGDSLWLTRSPETSPLLLWSYKNPLTIGATTIASAYIGSDAAGPAFSINATSDVAFAVTSDRIYLLTAHPDPGVAPGNPVLPVGPPLPGGGWQFFVNCRQYGLPVTHPNPLWCDAGSSGVYFDPPLATGYQYTVDAGAPNFGSILIPAALAGGQTQFTVTYNGVSEPLTAGHQFKFTDRFPQGVAAFSVTGIDADEQLDATNPQAFVAALTFLVLDNPNASFKMVPIVGGAIPTITPAISGKQGANGWYASDVTVNFLVSDPSSRVTAKSGCDDAVVTADTAATSFTCTLEGSGGPWSSTVTIRRDTAPPGITVNVPTGSASYPVGAAVTAIYVCQDALSGIASCTGSVANGSPIDTATAGNKTLSVTATDNAGNVASQSLNYVVTAVTADTTPPVITSQVAGTPGDNGWYRSDVSLSWAVSDPQSAISASRGCTTTRVTSDTNGTTFTCTATSKGGTASKSVTIKRDDDAPLAVIVFPFNGLTFNRNERLPALYGCLDLRSGVAQCNGTVPNGSRIDTATAGVKIFSLSARDKAGNVRTSTVHYTVR